MRSTISLALLLLLRAALPANTCGEDSLLDTAEQMTLNMCVLYTKSLLGKINEFLVAPNGNITYQLYDFEAETCGPFMDLPLNIFFPVMFRVEHECFAAIPVTGVLGDDSLVTVSGYAKLFVQTTNKIKEITLIYTAPHNDCTLKLQSMIMADVQCRGLQLPTTTTGPGTSGGPGTETNTATNTVTNTTTGTTTRFTTPTPTVSSPVTTSRRQSAPDDSDRYTSIIATTGDVLDSENNPALHNALPVCLIKSGRMRVVMVRATRAQASLVCVRKGLRFAALARDDLADAIALVATCVGTGRAVWIKGYWGRSAAGSCLELAAGEASRTGGINAVDCAKQQAVLCEDPYFVV